MMQDKKTKDNPNQKQPYKKPLLIPLGDIRDVTMGGSPGSGDSGGAGFQDPQI